jgi:WD40 repeat protein
MVITNRYLYVEQGQQELLQGQALHATVYLSKAYQAGETEPMLRLLLAQAMRSVEAELASLEGHTSGVESAQFSADGTRVVTASWDQTGKVWDAASGQLLTSLEGHTGGVWSAQFSPDGTRLVTTSADKTVKVWEVGSGRLLASLKGSAAKAQSAQFSPDGTRLVTASEDKIALVWNVSLETRSPAEIMALVRCRVPWRLEAGQLLPATPDSTSCPSHSTARGRPQRKAAHHAEDEGSKSQ